jgi:hypothetical protein
VAEPGRLIFARSKRPSWSSHGLIARRTKLARALARSLVAKTLVVFLPCSPFPPRWHSAGIRFRLIPPFSSSPRVAPLFATTYITSLPSRIVFKVTFSRAGIIQVINKITNPALFPLLKRWTNVAWLFEIIKNHLKNYQESIHGFHEKMTMTWQFYGQLFDFLIIEK